MINKTLRLISILVLAISPLVVANTWAASHESKTEENEECVSQDAYLKMSEEEKAVNEVCEGNEGEDTSNEDEDTSNKPDAVAEEGSTPKTEAEEPADDESKVNCIPEETFRAMSAEDKEKRIDERCEGSE